MLRFTITFSWSIKNKRKLKFGLIFLNEKGGNSEDSGIYFRKSLFSRKVKIEPFK